MINIKTTENTEKSLTMMAYEDEKKLGYVKAALGGKSATVEEIYAEMEYIDFALLKALLNALDLKGVEEVKCHIVKLFPLLEKAGFKILHSFAYLNLEGYFSQENC